MGSPLETLPSPELLQRLQRLVHRERITETELLVHLAEVDARRLYQEEACSSMFSYCVRVLHFAEGAAYKRIQVARAARRHPALLEALRRGDLHLTAASLISAALTTENADELIAAAKHRTAEEVRALLADRRPRPDVPATVRRVSEAPPVKAPAPRVPPPVPERLSAPAPSLPTPRPEPLGGERYCVRFTADPETHAKLQELRALMRHQVPDGDLGKILARAVTTLLAQVRKQKFAEVEKPRAEVATTPPSPSRSIPAAIRREVARRDEGRCTYVSSRGRRCDSREFLEFHHEDPWERSRTHSVAGITLRCRAHNQYQAERDFGRREMVRFQRGAPRGTGFETSSPDPSYP